MTTIYDYQAVLEDSTSYSMEKYRGKPVIIVNTATKCGLAPQFEELEALYKKYKSQGLVILGFPSNQFKQEVATAEEAAEACRMTYGVTFPMHQLIKVNGEAEDPLFTYLKENTSGTLNQKIKWNFTKFLINKEGRVIERFAPQTSPLKMEASIEKIL